MDNRYDIKQVILVRRDLRNALGQKVRSSKLGVQIGHASMAWIGERLKTSQVRSSSEEIDQVELGLRLNTPEYYWLVQDAFPKMVLGVENVAELQEYHRQALAVGFPSVIITDAGHTEFTGPTITCVGIGPAWSKDLDVLTGHLKPL